MSSDIDFMTELEAAKYMRPSLQSKWLLICIVFFVIFFLVWAYVCEIDIIARGQGQVVPTHEIQIVQSLEGGILQDLLVSEGDIVEKGQVLLRISDVHFSSEERGTEAKFLALQSRKLRLEAEAKGSKFSLPDELLKRIPDITANELSLYKSRQAELENVRAILDDKINKGKAELSEVKAKISGLQSSRKLLKDELEITSRMVAQKVAPKIEELRLQREMTGINSQISAGREHITGLDAQLRGLENERKDTEDKFRTKALSELSDVETSIASLQESLKSIEDRVFRTELRSPAKGVVNNIAIKTIGGVIEPAQRLIEIVPIDDDLKILARVSPNDIAFLKQGQKVNVKITAYNPRRYGTLEGHLERIGASSVSDRDGNIFFEIEVRTNKNHLGSEDAPLPVTPGMIAQTDIITGKRTIMEYLGKPIILARDKALRER